MTDNQAHSFVCTQQGKCNWTLPETCNAQLRAPLLSTELNFMLTWEFA